MITRQLTAPQTPTDALNVLTFGVCSSTKPIPIGLSHDRSTVFGAYGNTLYQSTNDCATWTTVSTFSAQVAGFLETDDGEVLVSCQAAAATPGYLYKSSGWSASHASATWALALTSQSGAYFRNGWGFGESSFGTDARVADSGKYGFVGEYGSQTPTAGAATAAYFTSDYGKTWSKVYDLITLYPGLSADHVLCVAYDPWWDRLVVCHQTRPTSDQYMYVEYSDDHGATWQIMPLPSWVAPGAFISQNTTLTITEDAYLFGSDHSGPGIVRAERLGYRRLGNPYSISLLATHTGAQMISLSGYRHRGLVNAPYLYGLISSTAIVSPILIVSRDCCTFVEAWRDDNLASGGVGEGGVTGVNHMSFMGPTRSGKIIGVANKSSTQGLYLVGELIPGVSGDRAHYFNVMGDGATTTFNFAHGMPYSPSHYSVMPQTYAAVNTAAPTVTTSATNVTLTYATAPASGALLGYAARYA